jgi:hypothetical protein
LSRHFSPSTDSALGSVLIGYANRHEPALYTAAAGHYGLVAE